MRPRILAVRPSTKSLGVAILDRTTLLFAGVHSIRRRRSQGETMTLRLHRIRTHLADLITLYRPTVLVCEALSRRRLGAAPILALMQAEIFRIAQQHGIPLKRVPVDTVLRGLTPHTCLKKKELAAALAQCYPQLYYHLAPFPTDQWKYWQPMMEAIGLGLVSSLRAEREHGC